MNTIIGKWPVHLSLCATNLFRKGLTSDLSFLSLAHSKESPDFQTGPWPGSWEMTPEP